MKRKHSVEDIDIAESARREAKLFRSCDDLPCSSNDRAQTASSPSASPSNSYLQTGATTHKATFSNSEGVQSSTLDSLLGRLSPCVSTYQFLSGLGLSSALDWHHEQTTANGSAQVERETRRRKCRKGVPRKRSFPTSQVNSAESPPIKKAKRSDSECNKKPASHAKPRSKIKKAKRSDSACSKRPASHVKARSLMTLIGQYQRKPQVSSRQTYKSLIANWKKQLNDWKKKNREIDSKNAHTMKYPSHLHEWMQRVRYNHKRKWQMYKYEEPKWTKWQLSQTQTPQCSTSI